MELRYLCNYYEDVHSYCFFLASLVQAALILEAFSKILLSLSLGAHDGFTQPIFYKRFDRFSLYIKQNA